MFDFLKKDLVKSLVKTMHPRLVVKMVCQGCFWDSCWNSCQDSRQRTLSGRLFVGITEYSLGGFFEKWESTGYISRIYSSLLFYLLVASASPLIETEISRNDTLCVTCFANFPCEFESMMETINVIN